MDLHPMSVSSLSTLPSVTRESGLRKGQLTARTIRTVSEIDEIRQSWEAWQRHPNADIDLYLMLLGIGSPHLRPYIIVVYRDEIPEAILIGRVDRRKIELKIGYRSLFRPEVLVLTFIYEGLLGNTSTEICQVLAEVISTGLGNRDADVVYFNLLRTDSPLFQFISQSPGWLVRDHFLTCQPHRALILPGTVDQFRQNLTPKVRKNQKWQAGKLTKTFSGDVIIKCFRDVDELECAIQDIEKVAQKTYQRGLGVGFIDTPLVRECLRLEARRQRLRVYVLYVRGKSCAFWVGTLYQGVFHSNSMGYDPAFANYSPGMFLIMRVIEAFFNQNSDVNVRAVDFGFGDAQYKKVLGDREWQEASIYLFGSTIKALKFNFMRSLTAVAMKLARSSLERTKFLPRIKKSWRERLRRHN